MTIKIWDSVKVEMFELTLKGHDEATESLSFSPNGERLMLVHVMMIQSEYGTSLVKDAYKH
jgi:WD40 repeat protein